MSNNGMFSWSRERSSWMLRLVTEPRFSDSGCHEEAKTISCAATVATASTVFDSPVATQLPVTTAIFFAGGKEYLS
jgi:hypothetical protein